MQVINWVTMALLYAGSFVNFLNGDNTTGFLMLIAANVISIHVDLNELKNMFLLKNTEETEDRPDDAA